MPSTQPLVRLHDLRKTFRGTSRPALDGVSLDILPGEVFGIIGRSGAGPERSARGGHFIPGSFLTTCSPCP